MQNDKAPRAGCGADERTFEVCSELGASAARVWEHATDLRGINAELMPLMRMTSPKGWATLSADRVRLGERLFRSWLLLFGVLPIDYDDLTIVELQPGRRFLERSPMMSASVWEHERVVEATSTTTCRVSDRLSYRPRLAPLGFVLGWLVPRVFAHRHRQLRRRFGDAGGSDADPYCPR